MCGGGGGGGAGSGGVGWGSIVREGFKEEAALSCFSKEREDFRQAERSGYNSVEGGDSRSPEDL